MLNSSILDVAIGMAFIYLLLSLIASTVQEAIASVLQLRPANLEHGIRSLFSGGTLVDGKLFIDRLYRHGLIMGLYRDKTDSTGIPVIMSKTQVLEQKVESWRERMRRWLQVHPSIPIPGVTDPFLLPAYIPGRTFSIALLDILKVESQKSSLSVEDYLKSLCTASDGAPPAASCAAAEAMLSLLRDAFDNDSRVPPLEKFRCHLENWYNDAMDRASGWYKKYTQNVLLCIGLILAIVFNVDSITVGKKLWFDKDARSGLINAAGSYVGTHTSPPKVPAQPGETTLTRDELVTQMKTTVQAFNDVSEDYLLPVGWHAPVKWYHYNLLHPESWSPLRMLAQTAGWCITALALSLGAPFWFDLLNKFMVVRSTVKPSEKSRTEGSKDAT